MLAYVLALFTAYSAYCNGCSGIMFSGLPADYTKNYISADLNFWNIGDKVEICFSPDVCKVYSIQDKGGAIKGKWRFDLLVKNNAEALIFGKKELYVRSIN